MKTIEEIRHANLLAILAELAQEHGGERGAIQRLASAMGRSHSQLSQIKTRTPHSGTGKPRNIGSVVARSIEVAAGKPRGWLDTEHSGTGASGVDSLTRLIQDELDRRGVGSAQGESRKRTGTDG